MPHGERIGEETAVRRLLQAWEVDPDQNTDMGGGGASPLEHVGDKSRGSKGSISSFR